MTETTYNWYRTPIGFVTIAADEVGICRVVFGCEDIPNARKVAKGLTTAAATQLLEYFSGKRQAFDLPLHLMGSPYRLAVWDAVREIPYGQCETSASLAEKMALATSATAVGGALRENPLPIIIPEHRVIAANGKPLGSGRDAERRAWLLRFEQSR